jgi:antitoxin ParD1/3/4
MPSTLNISLTDDQKGWLNSRREAGGYASASDVVRDLIRSEQEAERRQLAQQFRAMQRDGSNEPEPAAAVMARVRRIKKERRAT